MAKEITMPKLSDTMTEGLFAGWRKNVGDRIERGDIIAEIETDKAVMELEAFASGVLLKTMATGGEQLPVGAVLGLIGEPGELDEPAVPVPAPAPEAAASAAPVAAPPPTAPSAPAEPPPALPHSEQDHEKASPMVRRMARDQGIDLAQVHGSGPDGRITQEDLAAVSPQQEGTPGTSATPASQPATASQQALPVEPAAHQPASSMRQAIAAAVTQSWQTIPHFSVAVEIDMDACREIISELKGGAHQLGYNALLLKACASVLGRYPLLQASDAASRDGIHISFAVALPDGLLMPVIRHCDHLTAAGIELEAARLAEKCRAGRLSSEELSGGCFSVSNLGMYGVDDFTALILPGQTAILAVGAVAERPVVREGQVVAAATMRLTLCCDHRIVDGAYAARFLADLRVILEKPVSLLV
ncbi:MAG: dihydrolipoamide acetyltransferase family protein [Geobacteraceae bacterium]|nr:dihydrolipoamide acetyltransferase family protein [Geobacteraceae bacterium]